MIKTQTKAQKRAEAMKAELKARKIKFSVTLRKDGVYVFSFPRFRGKYRRNAPVQFKLLVFPDALVGDRRYYQNITWPSIRGVVKSLVLANAVTC